MSASRDQIRGVLADLVAKQDKVLADAPGLEKLLQAKFVGMYSQEIAAVKAALIEKVPWNLRRNNETVASRRMIQDLGSGVARAHAVSLDLACWAVESWALSLRMTLETLTKAAPATPASASIPTSTPTPKMGANAVSAPQAAPLATATVSTSTDGQAAASTVPARITPTTRMGLIYGVDDRGCMRVYQVWWNPVGGNEAASALASQVKPEPQRLVHLFEAASVNKSVEATVTSDRLGHIPAGTPKNTTTPAPRSAASVAAGGAPALPPKAPVSTPVPGAVRSTAIPPSAPTPRASTPQPTPVRPVAPAPVKPPQPVAAPPAAPSLPPRIPASRGEELYDQAMAILNGSKAVARSGEVIQLLQQSAGQGYVLAETRLGELCMRGRVVKEDLPTAVRWLQSAAQKGEPEAQTVLGSLYQCGMGVPLDLNEAQKWLQRAAKQGNAEAQQLLKQILET